MRNKIYTKVGDQGETSIIGGERVSKSAPRLDAYGSVDELNAVLGVVLSLALPIDKKKPKNEDYEQKLRFRLSAVQNQLFNVGSQLACIDEKLRAQLPQITVQHVQALESDIDLMDSVLPELKEFILPGGTPWAAVLHQARTVCRRAERKVVSLDDPSTQILIKYLNRLGDYFFVAARFANHLVQAQEIKWQKE